MNYYPFHLGDYASHTAHLEPIEDIAYRRMLDLYYRTEKPLPDSVEEIARLIRMRDHAATIRDILNEFFKPSPEGYRNPRCDEEISSFAAMVEGGRKGGLKAAEKRRGSQGSTPHIAPLAKGYYQPEPEPEPNNLETTSLVASAAPTPRIPVCPVDEIVNAFHEKLPMLPRITVLSQSRKVALRARWREVITTDKMTAQEGLEFFVWFFERVACSPFLTGRTQSRDGRSWRADFDWLMKPTNFAKTVEGNYHKEAA